MLKPQTPLVCRTRPPSGHCTVVHLVFSLKRCRPREHPLQPGTSSGPRLVVWSQALRLAFKLRQIQWPRKVPFFLRVQPSTDYGCRVLEFRAVGPAARSPKVPTYIRTEPRSLCDWTSTLVKHQPAHCALIGHSQNKKPTWMPPSRWSASEKRWERPTEQPCRLSNCSCKPTSPTDASVPTHSEGGGLGRGRAAGATRPSRSYFFFFLAGLFAQFEPGCGVACPQAAAKCVVLLHL